MYARLSALWCVTKSCFARSGSSVSCENVVSETQNHGNTNEGTHAHAPARQLRVLTRMTGQPKPSTYWQFCYAEGHACRRITNLLRIAQCVISRRQLDMQKRHKHLSIYISEGNFCQCLLKNTSATASAHLVRMCMLFKQKHINKLTVQATLYICIWDSKSYHTLTKYSDDSLRSPSDNDETVARPPELTVLRRWNP